MHELDPARLLSLAALVGATAVGLTLVVRRAPVISSWVAAGIKPWACNLCCATWSTLALSVAAALLLGDAWTLLAWLPAIAIATWGLHQADPPPPPDFGAAPMPEPDEDLP